ncbi:MAG: hypothetical protein BWY49_00810 [Candidatus Omnitrophica bacterium ADurb.Bin314]|nr:MAG: hypothetical protein BWY49_00810 [Candidatus Omnitrophica bacterium ADurb.Bin314]
MGGLSNNHFTVFLAGRLHRGLECGCDLLKRPRVFGIKAGKVFQELIDILLVLDGVIIFILHKKQKIPFLFKALDHDPVYRVPLLHIDFIGMVLAKLTGFHDFKRLHVTFAGPQLLIHLFQGVTDFQKPRANSLLFNLVVALDHKGRMDRIGELGLALFPGGKRPAQVHVMKHKIERSL